MTTPIFGFSGVGKSTYANEFPAIARDMQQGDLEFDRFLEDVLEELGKQEHRYVFLPCDSLLRQELVRRGIAFVVILPDYILRWVKRWLKAGDSADCIKRRVETLDAVEEAFSGDPVLYLSSKHNEWIGNVLSQYGDTSAKKEER